MNRQVSLIVGGIVLFIVLVLVFFIFLLPRTTRIFPFSFNRNITPTPPGANLGQILEKNTVPEGLQPLLGEGILLAKNQVKAVINKKVFWTGALSGDKNMIVVSGKDLDLKPGDIISISGNVKNISEITDQAKNWGLSQKDGEIIKQNPVYIEAKDIKVLE